MLKYADDLEEAQRRLLALLAEARASADLSSIAYTLAHLPHVALWQGQIGRARQFAEEHLDVAEQGSLAALAGQARYNLGHVMAHEGRLDEAEDVLVSRATTGPRRRTGTGCAPAERSASSRCPGATRSRPPPSRSLVCRGDRHASW